MLQTMSSTLAVFHLHTECPKIYRKSVLHQVYRKSILEQMQHRLEVNFVTLCISNNCKLSFFDKETTTLNSSKDLDLNLVPTLFLAAK